MSNYFEYNDRIAFHPGYYVKELVEEYGITQEDFAMRLGTTPKNLSKLINGEQNLSTDMAIKISRLVGNTTEFWLNLQKGYDALVAEFESEQELEREIEIMKFLDYNYFKKYFGLPDYPRNIRKQAEAVRDFLKVSSLTVLTKYDMAASFRSSTGEHLESNLVRANAMVQIAINRALNVQAPKYNKRQFERMVEYALKLTSQHEDFYPLLFNAFLEAGVIFEILPNLSGSKINGASKKLGDKIMLMVNDRRLYSDTFWFTLFHEIGHILNGNFGMTIEDENDDREETADLYAANKLIPDDKYQKFVHNNHYFTPDIIIKFGQDIERDPGIVLGRLQNDGYIEYTNRKMNSLRRKYKIVLEQ